MGAWYRRMFTQEDPVRIGWYLRNEKSMAEVDFIIEKLGLQPGMKVLDLCCGQGRHLLDLAERGYDVTGVDLSPFMLGKCREFAAEGDLEPKLVQVDMREISFETEFDAVYNLRTSFGYLESDNEDQKVLDAVSRVLKPGGRFLIDLLNRDELMSKFLEHRWEQNDKGDIIVIDAMFDSVTGRIICNELAIHPDGSRTPNNHTIRLYTYGELEKMLRKAGLSIESAWGGWDSSTFSYRSRRMMILSVKAGNGD